MRSEAPARNPLTTRRSLIPSDRPVRLDIQALRAIAVALVVVYHLRPAALPGGFVGVDVFFVISGFLITSHLLTRPPARGRDLATFWARRIRRLLPAALLVIATTLVAARLIAPATDWSRNAREALASTFYVENWALVRSATDYLSADTSPSPFQHFWSLAVEEQFYIGWPLLLGATWLLVRHRAHPRRLAGLVVLAVVVVSFICSLMMTESDPSAAYFVTFTRLWELAAGGALAVVAPRLRLSRFVATAAAWIGLFAILGSALVLDGSDQFPGWRAAVPVLGAVVFLAADASGRLSPVGPLAVRPVQWLGDVSYSVYLWHWPIIALAPFALDRSPTNVDQLAIALLTLGLAAISYRLVEERWRHPQAATPLRRPFVAALAAMFVVAGLSAAQTAEVDHREGQARQQVAEVRRAAKECFGAGALAHLELCDQHHLDELAIEPDVAAKDRSWVFAKQCFEIPPYPDMPTCTFGSGSVRIALVGNSHTAHLSPALTGINATVTTFLASECTTVDARLEWDSPAKSAGCYRWTRRVLAATSGDRFDLIVTSQRNVHALIGHAAADRYDALQAAYRSYLERWTSSGARVLVVKDTPFPADDVGSIPTCVAEHRDDLERCSGDPARWIPVDPLAKAADQVDGADVVDLNRYICRPARCDAVNGTVITYLDGSHLTETYARTLAPYLQQAITDALDTADRTLRSDARHDG